MGVGRIFSKGGNVDIFPILFRILWRCDANGCSRNALPFLLHNENGPWPRPRQQPKKCILWGAIAKYSTIIHKMGYMQIFKAWYFSNKHCHGISPNHHK